MFAGVALEARWAAALDLGVGGQTHPSVQAGAGGAEVPKLALPTYGRGQRGQSALRAFQRLREPSSQGALQLSCFLPVPAVPDLPCPSPLPQFCLFLGRVKSGVTVFSKLKIGPVVVGEVLPIACLGRSGTQGPFGGDLGWEVGRRRPLQAAGLGPCCSATGCVPLGGSRLSLSSLIS